MGRYLDIYRVVHGAKLRGLSRPPKLSPHIRARIQAELFGTRLKTLFESPEGSRLWREFELACRRLEHRGN